MKEEVTPAEQAAADEVVQDGNLPHDPEKDKEEVVENEVEGDLD